MRLPGRWPVARVAQVMAFATMAFASACVEAQNVVVNGDFAQGLEAWSAWDALPEQGYLSWVRDTECYTPPISLSCGNGGNAAYMHSGGGIRTRGGIYQVIPVLPGRRYRLSWRWRGHAQPASMGNSTSWSMLAFEGQVSPATQAPAPGDVVATMGFWADPLGIYFNWLPIEREIQINPGTTHLTLALRHESWANNYCSLALDDVHVELLAGAPAAMPSIPAHDRWALMTLAFGLLAIAVTWEKTRSTQSIA